MGEAVQGNGTTLGIHEFRLKTHDEKLEAIYAKLDVVSGLAHDHEGRIDSLETWQGRLWMSMAGVTMLGITAYFTHFLVK